MKNLLKKYMIRDYRSDDFGRGKSKTSKGRHRRKIKKRSQLCLGWDYE